MKWYLKALKHYAKFNGRARRKEYWYFCLISFLISVLLGFIPENAGMLRNIYSIGVLIPSVAVTVRRLHDTNRSGWWFFINLIPIIGNLVFLWFMIDDSSKGKNRFGRSPKESLSN